MRQENVIVVKNIKKQFRVYKDKGSSLKERVLFRERNQYEERTVLDGISFCIKRGEAVGLIGRNGSGKSTLLKLLTKIMYPDAGSVEVTGRVSSLLELGAGFHPDMSGRDNIYTNASIFGLTKKEIDDRLDTIIDFSELRNYIDNPVRTYSSGMYMRLAFSVAINVNADVLLIDEILAVGDANFQDKCLKKLRQIKNQGTTIVLVSHSLQQIESFCDRSIWINDGKIVADNAPYPVHLSYLQYMSGIKVDDGLEDNKHGTEKGNDILSVESIKLKNKKGKSALEFNYGDTMCVSVTYKVKKPLYANIKLSVVRKDGVRCYDMDYKKEKGKEFYFDKDLKDEIIFSDLHLLANAYKISIIVEDRDGKELCAAESEMFQIETEIKETGVFLMEHQWR